MFFFFAIPFWRWIFDEPWSCQTTLYLCAAIFVFVLWGVPQPTSFSKKNLGRKPRAKKKKGILTLQVPLPKSAKQPPTHTEAAGPICNGKGPSCWKPCRNNNWSLTMSVLVVWVLVIIILEKKNKMKWMKYWTIWTIWKTLFSCFVGVLPKREHEKIQYVYLAWGWGLIPSGKRLHHYRKSPSLIR